MQPQEFLPVNWSDGMKINKTHFIAQDNAFTYRLAQTVSSFVNEHNYGLLPILNSQQEAAKLFLSLDNEQTVHLRIQHCRAITRGGYVIEFNADTSLNGNGLSVMVPGLQVPFNRLKERADAHYVVLSLNPYERAPFGEADPRETPARLPFIAPSYSLQLIAVEETDHHSIGDFQVPVGKVVLNEQAIRLVENYIPPCTAVNSHRELSAVHAGLEQFFGQMELYALQIIQKINQKNQQNTLASAIYRICESITAYTATECSNFRLTYLYQPPVMMVTAVSGMARTVKNTIDFFVGPVKDELMNYFATWCGVTQEKLETSIIEVSNYRYHHTDINDALEKATAFTRIVSALFGNLARLEYIGKKEDGSIFVKEQPLTSEALNNGNRKRGSFLAE